MAGQPQVGGLAVVPQRGGYSADQRDATLGDEAGMILIADLRPAEVDAAGYADPLPQVLRRAQEDRLPSAAQGIEEQPAREGRAVAVHRQQRVAHQRAHDFLPPEIAEA